MKKWLLLGVCFVVGLILLIFILSKDEEEIKEEGVSLKSIGTEDLKEKLDNPEWVIVDTRLNDAYNGWILDGETRGGHITGAVDFSANWINIDVKDKEKILDEALVAKGISKEKNIVLYDSDITFHEDAFRVATFLEKKGYANENLFLYDINEWAADQSLPMEKFENYHLIVPAKVVHELLQGGKPETFENTEFVKMVECSWGEASEEYNKGHIPTSFHINTDSFEPEPTWMLDTDENLAKWAIENGFTKDDTVIVSGENQTAAYRLAVVLRYIGVKDVRVLNGGNSAFTSAGYELEKESHLPVPVADFGASIPVNPSVILTTQELKEKLTKQNDFCLVDNRGWDEFIGETSGYRYHDKKGRIEGSYYGYAGTEGSGDLNYFRNIDNTMRNPNEFIALWKEQGIDITNELAFMCGSGWRAAEVMYYAEVAGIENISLYSDGWIGWSNGNNPSISGDVN